MFTFCWLLIDSYGAAFSQNIENNIDNWALYSQSMTKYPEEKIREIAESENYYVATDSLGNKTYIYEWSDLKVKVNIMPKEKMKNHLEGFVGYVGYLSSLSHTTPNKDLIKRISNTTMVFGIIIDPSRDKSGRAQNGKNGVRHA